MRHRDISAGEAKKCLLSLSGTAIQMQLPLRLSSRGRIRLAASKSGTTYIDRSRHKRPKTSLDPCVDIHILAPSVALLQDTTMPPPKHREVPSLKSFFGCDAAMSQMLTAFQHEGNFEAYFPLGPMEFLRLSPAADRACGSAR